MRWLKSLTVQGSLLAALGYLARPEVLALLPEKYAAVVTAVGAVAAAFGLRRKFPVPQ